jgi:hypothetical protein
MDRLPADVERTLQMPQVEYHGIIVAPPLGRMVGDLS